MAINKIIVDGVTKIDLTQDTATADKVLEGYTFHDATGSLLTGTMKAGADLSKLNVKYAYDGYGCENASSSPVWIGVYDSNSNTMSWGDDYKILTISNNNITISSEELPYISGSDKAYVISTKQINSVDVTFPEACGS